MGLICLIVKHGYWQTQFHEPTVGFLSWSWGGGSVYTITAKWGMEQKNQQQHFLVFFYLFIFIFYSCVTFGYARKVSCVINEKVKIRIRRKLKLHSKKGIMLWGNVKVPSKSDDHSFMFSSPTVIRNGALYVASCPGCLHQRTKRQSIVLVVFLIMQYRWVMNICFS